MITSKLIFCLRILRYTILLGVKHWSNIFNNLNFFYCYSNCLTLTSLLEMNFYNKNIDECSSVRKIMLESDIRSTSIKYLIHIVC